jgi:hypothetical protein
MKKISLFLLICTFSSKAFSQSFNPKYGSPVLVLIVTNPWLMVIGSDVPSFVVYENGQIIYKKTINNVVKYYEANLGNEEAKKTISELGLTDSLLKLPKYINASNSSDQPTNELLLNLDSLTEISVYGNLRETNGEARLKTPQPFLTIYDNIIKYENSSAKTWLPDSIEVIVSGYSYAPEKSLLWPQNWPDLKSNTTVKRGDSLYSIYLDKKYFNEFIKLRSSLKEKQAILINGKKFSISYRLPFPNLK